MAGRTPVLGVIGGIGSGKSTVARQLETLGAVRLEADRVGHEVLRRRDVKSRARALWGDAVFGPDGQIDRSKLADIVFAPGPAAMRHRAALERLVHPLIKAELQRRIETLQQDPAIPLIVLDAAVLLEAGWDDVVDAIVYVDAPRVRRLERVRDSRKWDSRRLELRESAQKPLTWKRKRADYVVDNSGSLEQTLEQVERIYTTLTQGLPT
jgi:dephospho-CoA kinase